MHRRNDNNAQVFHGISNFIPIKGWTKITRHFCKRVILLHLIYKKAHEKLHNSLFDH